MSDGSDPKTKEDLLAEIAALKEQLAQRDRAVAKPVAEGKAVTEDKATAEGAGSAAPVFAAPMTRRQSIVSWVAPVILSLPVVQVVGAVIKPGTAQAATDDSVVSTVAPTRAGRCIIAPTAAAPTAKPTAKPTAAPTTLKKGAPTAKPTVNPAAPTIGMASTPDSRPIADGFVALGAARALVRADIGW